MTDLQLIPTVELLRLLRSHCSSYAFIGLRHDEDVGPHNIQIIYESWEKNKLQALGITYRTYLWVKDSRSKQNKELISIKNERVKLIINTIKSRCHTGIFGAIIDNNIYIEQWESNYKQSLGLAEELLNNLVSKI